MSMDLQGPKIHQHSTCFLLVNEKLTYGFKVTLGEVGLVPQGLTGPSSYCGDISSLFLWLRRMTKHATIEAIMIAQTPPTTPEISQIRTNRARKKTEGVTDHRR